MAIALPVGNCRVGEELGAGGGQANPPSDGLAVPRTFVRLCILLLLAERRCHGYGLKAQLESFGFDGA